jgi:hypothetical protein
MNDPHDPELATSTPSAPADSLTAGRATGFGWPASHSGRPTCAGTAPPPGRVWRSQVLHACRKHTKELPVCRKGKAAYRTIVALGHPDAHYKLADLLSELREDEEARRHWRAYLQCDQQSRWARYARSRLEKTS